VVKAADNDVQQVILSDHLAGERRRTQQLDADVHDAVAHGQLVSHVHQHCRHVRVVLHIAARECILPAQDNNSMYSS